jgi:NMD protein affecting ribosome stability and mRNA decay
MQRNVDKFGFSDKRGRTRTSTDPYLPEAGLKEPAVCQSCQAIYQQKRWQLDPLLATKLADDPATHWVTCPACQKIAEHYPEGILTLRGSYLWNHEQEIHNILINAANRFTARNPLERIIRMQRTAEALIIETTANKLAEQLGRSLQKAHSGELQIDWQGAPVICRVQWERWQ